MSEIPPRITNIAADILKLHRPDKAPEQANCAVGAGSALSPAQRTLLSKTGSEWMNVPPATRANTVLSLKKRGLIQHRSKYPLCFGEWVTWGEIRLTPNK